MKTKPYFLKQNSFRTFVPDFLSMKTRFFSPLILAFLLTSGLGCTAVGNTFSNEAEAVETAENYLKALQSKDYAKAKSMATEESATYIDMALASLLF